MTAKVKYMYSFILHIYLSALPILGWVITRAWNQLLWARNRPLPPYITLSKFDSVWDSQSVDISLFLSFRINSSTGEIFTNEALDREVLNTHLLIVQARDMGVPQLQSTAVRVSITVTDINDNVPRFFEARPKLNTVKNNLLCGTYNRTVSIFALSFTTVPEKKLYLKF